ncbi:MAG: hypothetical protein JNL98_30110 [Bryobacterales bacterium]|nr:hypothetical protein [Bryobacterales bacterium]
MSYTFADTPAPGFDFRVVLPIFETGHSLRLLPDGIPEQEGDSPPSPVKRYRTFLAVRSEGMSYVWVKTVEDDGLALLAETPKFRAGLPLDDSLPLRRIARSAQPIASMSAAAHATGTYTVTYRTATGVDHTVRVGADIFPIDGAPLYEDVTLRTQVTTTRFLFSRVTGLFHGTVTVRNTGTTPIEGPIHMVVDGLTPGVQVANPAGLFQGKAYLTLPAISLAPNAQTQVMISFMNPSMVAIKNTWQILSGPIF